MRQGPFAGDRNMEKSGGYNVDNLIRAAMQGDSEAFGALVDIYRNRIRFYLWKRVGNLHDAEDLTQDVFTKAYKAIGRFRQKKSCLQRCFEGWLFTLARNVATDYVRELGRHKLSYPPPGWGRSEDLSPDEVAERIEKIEDLAEALERAKLSAKEKAALDLKYVRGVRYKQIALLQNCSTGTVKKTIFRALEKLKNYLQQKE